MRRFKMMSVLLSVVLCCFYGLVNAAESDSKDANQSPVGQWNTIDDETGKVKSVVEIREADGVLSGVIVKLVNPSEPNPLCNKCKGEKANKPIQGLEIMWGLKRKGDSWSGGKVMDPKKGKIYKAKISLLEGGDQLKLRGYIGVPTLGRTQIWQRVK